MPVEILIPEGAEPGEVPMPTGLPRPFFAGKPVPWTATFGYGNDGELEVDFSTVDEVRSQQSRKERHCALCGDQVEGEVAVIATSDRRVVDSVVLHLRCARITHRHCPHLAHGYTIWTGDPADLAVSSDGRLLHDLAVPESFRPVETRTNGETIRFIAAA